MKPKTGMRRVLFIIATIIYALIALAFGIWQGYLVNWTGFKDFTPPNDLYVRGKTLWDWMDLLLIPLILAVAAYALNRAERIAERERAKETEELQLKIATERHQEAALQAYLDKMTDLLLKEKLRTSKNNEVRNMAKIRTITLLRGLDANRKRLVLIFLKETGLIDLTPIISLDGADLSGIDAISLDFSASNLSGAILDRSNLNGANLEGADLRQTQLVESQMIGTHLNKANLFEANLQQAKLVEAKLIDANLNGINLTSADLSEADLTGAALNGADLTAVNLSGADLTGTSLKGANLTAANLFRARLYGASLNGAYFNRVNLTFTEVTTEQLATAFWDG